MKRAVLLRTTARRLAAGLMWSACGVLASERAAKSQDFATALARAEAVRRDVSSGPKASQEAYAVALAAFLRLTVDGAERRAHLAEGAFCAWRAGDLRQAPALYAEAWRELEHSGALADQRLRALLDCGQAVQAIEFAKEVAVDHPRVVAAVLSGDGRGGDSRVLSAADGLLKANQTELGLWAFRTAAEGSPGNAAALANFALALRCVGYVAACRESYRQAMVLAPEDDLLCNDYALFLKGVGRVQEAIEFFHKGRELEKPPGSSPAIPNLVQLQLTLGKPLLADAKAAMATVLSVRPDAAFPRRLAIDLMLERRAEPKQR